MVREFYPEARLVAGIEDGCEIGKVDDALRRSYASEQSMTERIFAAATLATIRGIVRLRMGRRQAVHGAIRNRIAPAEGEAVGIKTAAIMRCAR